MQYSETLLVATRKLPDLDSLEAFRLNESYI